MTDGTARLTAVVKVCITRHNCIVSQGPMSILVLLTILNMHIYALRANIPPYDTDIVDTRDIHHHELPHPHYDVTELVVIVTIHDLTET